MRLQVTIKDQVIDYELIRLDIKNPRLEFREHRLHLIVPHDFKGHGELIHRHRRWIYRRYSRIQELKILSQGLELIACRSVEDFKELVSSFVSSIAEELGVAPVRTRFRKMKTKWGSCSSKGNLNFNSYMRYLPDEMIEYIVFHEMVHLIELNHSPRFWAHVKARFPDYESYEKRLTGYWSLIREQCYCQSL
ncbi:M48 family metallopeptidase [Methanolobus sp. WCC5]|uniref:M48 metallopeptidase family protein n=1 Tax=Methanolobus sp. WCC5 TaxID=3125785 RepID=UPI00324E035C